MPEQKNNDEIDLLELLLRVINAVRTNFWLIVLFFFLGTAVGLAYFFSSPKVFETKMIVSSGILTDAYTKVLFENVSRHIREGNTTAIAAQFNIPEKAAREVQSLKIENLIEAEAIDTKESERFLITVQVSDQQILPELEKGLIGYLENNDFAQIRVEQNRNYLKQMLANVDEEILDMEEFKQKIVSGDFFQSTRGNIMFDPTTVNSKILELKEKKINYQNNLQVSNGVQVIEGFTTFAEQTHPKLMVSLIAGSFVGLFFVGAFIAFKSIRKLLSLAEAAK